MSVIKGTKNSSDSINKESQKIIADTSDMKGKDVSPNDSREMINKNQIQVSNEHNNDEVSKSINNISRNTSRSKRKNYIVEAQKSAIENLTKRIDKKYILRQFFETKLFNQISILLTVFYSILMFCQFSIDDPTEQQNDSIDLVYFKQRMYIVDAIVIFLSLILVLMDYMITDSRAKLVSKFFRTIFRFLRLFMILRKIKDTNKKSNGSQIGEKTPVEKILGIIDYLKSVVTDEYYLKELEWSAQMISSNKLYEPILDKEQKELLKWMEQYEGKQKGEQKEDKQKKEEVKDKDKTVKKEEKTQLVAAPVPETIEEEFLYKKIQTNENAKMYFQNLESREFMIFEFFKENMGNELSVLTNYLFEQYDCFSKWKITPEILFQFTTIIQNKYLDNPYHNKIHAFDVTQTMYFFLKRCKFVQIGKLNKIDIGTALLSCAIHDVEHPGFNNPYQMNAKTPLTILYNDKSPLENHHLSVTFKLIRDNPNINIFKGVDKKIAVSIRENLIQMVLKTDMSQHFTGLAQLKGRLASNEFDATSTDKQLCLITLLHAADVSNPFKPFHIYQEWTHRVLNEFWIQGDLERQQSLPISYLCDRYTTNLAKSQMGFIDFIVKPFFETICQFLPDLSSFMPIFEQNKQEWQIYEEYYERQLAQLAIQLKAIEDQKKAEEEAKKKLNQPVSSQVQQQ